MPKKPVDYSKTIIYKLVCKDLSVKDLYVGHTTNWKQRKTSHKSDYKNKNIKVYKMMRENGGWDNWEMIEIEKYPCNDEREARARERYWYEQLHAELNMIRPIRTLEEIKEYVKEYNGNYYQNNKESIFEQIKEYLSRPEVKEHRKEWGKEYYSRPEVKKSQKEYQKEYRNNNKEKIKEYNKEYNQKNKEIISEKRKEKYTCECGITLTKCKRKRHERSKKHQKYIESLN